VYGEAHVDRSPCGTGTAAKLTLLQRKKGLRPGEPYVNAGPLGSTFTGCIVEETTVGGLDAVRVEIRGSAAITGVHEFVLDPKDPFPEGFLL
jgi:proline racemase